MTFVLIAFLSWRVGFGGSAGTLKTLAHYSDEESCKKAALLVSEKLKESNYPGTWNIFCIPETLVK